MPFWGWIAFHVVVFSILAFDLGVLNRKSHEVTLKAALGWTAFWIVSSLAFGAFIWSQFSSIKGLEFFTGYVVEYALSVDNIFVFILVFSYFSVPKEHQHRVLFWGIMGAFVMRGIMIFAGVALIERFEWLIYIFGAFLVYTGLKLAFGKDEEVDPGHNPAVNLLRRLMPVSKHYDGSKFITFIDGKKHATPLLAVLLVVETTDLIFAVDSIPAILGISRDPFIVYTSNVCAILGLRSLYFVLAGVMDLFHYLKYGLAAVLSFVGVKMLLSHTAFKIPVSVSLGVIVTILAISVLASLLKRPRHDFEQASPVELQDEPAEEAR